MTYEIIKDEQEFKKFINFLPELEDGECYFVMLLARKKYHEDLDHDIPLVRLVANNKKMLELKIRRLEVKNGCYLKNNGENVPQDSLALYIAINPKSFKRANKIQLNNLVNALYDNSVNSTYTTAISALQKARSRTVYVELDFDTGILFNDYMENVLKCINGEAVDVINTKNGFHIIVNTLLIAKEYKKTWYVDLLKYDECDVIDSNILSPVVGCVQSDFVPTFYDWSV